MLINLRVLAPPSFSGPTLLDDWGLPRYWAAVWASFLPAKLASATVAKKLGQLERFYQHSDEMLGAGGLDDALADLDVDALRNALEGYFLSIRNSTSITAASEESWQVAIQFVLECSERRSRNCSEPNRLAGFKAKLRDLELVRAQLHIGRRRRAEQVRSLPSEVLEYLYQLLEPESSINPLSVEGVTWIFEKITASLPQDLRKCLRDHTGKASISAHDLRHTCAVVRLNQLLSEGVEMDAALQKMRTFFGWSRESVMPLRYARAVFEDRLASIWKAEFDDRASFLRSIPVRTK